MKKNIFTYLILTILIGSALWSVYITFSFPVTGIHVELDRNNQWIINKFDSINVALEADLKIGDRIIEIDGVDANRYFSVEKWGSVDQAEKVKVSRAGKELVILIGEDHLSMIFNIVPLVISFFSFCMGMLLFRKLRGSHTACYLAYTFFNIGFIFISLGASIRGDALGKIMISTFVMLLPVVFLQFLTIFMREKGYIHRFERIPAYLYGALIFPLLALPGYFSTGAFAYYTYITFTAITILFTLFASILNFVYLSKIYLKYKAQQSYMSVVIKTIWAGLFISFTPMILFIFIPRLLYGVELINSIYISWCVLIIPLTFTYLLITKRLFDIDFILRRILMTVTIAFIPSLIIVALIGIFFADQTNISDLLLIFIGILILITFVLYSLERFGKMLESVIFPRKYYFNKSLRKISQHLVSLSNVQEMKGIILLDLINTLEVFGAAIVFTNGEWVEEICEGDIDAEKVKKMVISGSCDHSDYTCFPVNRHEEYSSYLIFTRKKNDTLFSAEEKQWLHLIISYLAVSLENVFLIRKLTMKLEQLAARFPNEEVANEFVWFRKLMFELQEKERLRIAADLHNSTMPEMARLKGELEIMQQYAVSEEAACDMRSVILKIDDIHSQLSQSFSQLHPQLTDGAGLVQTLQQYIDKERASAAFELAYSAEQPAIIDKCCLETKKHIFRMVQEMIGNAKEHSRASKVGIQLIAIDQYIVLLYEDDGVGFEQKRMLEEEAGSPFKGMKQIRTRVLHLNGDMKLETSAGAGVKIRITLPGAAT
ncbi:Sensor histidine kinase ComP [Paenibacillus sp. CECT 9249]|nr:Sensor histidine kinase ComP [Paenibacillus sp. CECT 9249]